MKLRQNVILYQIFVPSFFDSDGDGVGDLAGVTEKLPYLARLGVDSISLSGIFETTDQSSDEQITDYKKINPQIGTENDFRTLTETAHGLGLTIAVSVPFFATSKSHDWFEKSRSAQNEYNLYKDYYLWKKGNGAAEKRAPKLAADLADSRKYTFDSTNKTWYQTTRQGAPILNIDNPRVRKECVEILSYWKETGVDAFLLSGFEISVRKTAQAINTPVYKVVEDIFDTGRGVYRLLKDIREKIGDDFSLLLENCKTDSATIRYLLGDNKVVDSVCSASFLRTTSLPYASHFKIGEFLGACNEAFSTDGSEERTVFFENRTHRRILADLADPSDIQKLCMAAKSLCVFLMTATGAPALYQGQEIGMTDKRKKYYFLPFMKEESTFLETTPVQWDNKQNAGFTEAEFAWKPVNENYANINAAAEMQNADSVLSFYAKMIAYRKSNPALCNAKYIPLDTKNDKIVAFDREEGNEKLFVVCSFSSKDVNFTVPVSIVKTGGNCILSNYPIVSKSLHGTIGLRPYEARIYSLTKEEIKRLN